MFAFTRSQKIRKFWDWFLEHEQELHGAQIPPEQLQRPLSRLLERIQPDLTWEFGPTHDGRRGFVISAEGMKRAFPVVEEVVDSAPSMHRWTIKKFRQRMPSFEEFAVQVNDLKVGAKHIECVLTPSKGLVDIDLYIQGCRRSDDGPWVRIGFLMLDGALGEFDVATKMGELRVHPFQKKPGTGGQRIPFSAITTKFDALTARPG